MMKYVLAGLILVVGLSIAAAQAPGNDAKNALAVKATAALTARNWQEAERTLKLLTAMEPTRSDFQKSLGDAQGNLGHYADAVASYDKAIAQAAKSLGDANVDRAKVKAALGDMFTAKGNMFLKLKEEHQRHRGLWQGSDIVAQSGGGLLQHLRHALQFR